MTNLLINAYFLIHVQSILVKYFCGMLCKNNFCFYQLLTDFYHSLVQKFPQNNIGRKKETKIYFWI